MWKRILSLLLALVFFAAAPLLGGCEDKSDKIQTEQRTTVKDVPVGERIKVTGD